MRDVVDQADSRLRDIQKRAILYFLGWLAQNKRVQLGMWDEDFDYFAALPNGQEGALVEEFASKERG